MRARWDGVRDLVDVFADVDLVRIDGEFPSFSDDDRYIVHNDGFTGVAVCERDGSSKKSIYEVELFS